MRKLTVENDILEQKDAPTFVKIKYISLHVDTQ